MSDAVDAGAGTVAPDRTARDLLCELVEIPSPTGEERDCANRLREFFENRGREAWIDAVGNVRAPADDAVLLTSHVDTVPGEIPVRVETADYGEPVLYGRGSVDAKGPLAAMAVAAVRTGVSFVGVTGEETDSRGARHLVADRSPPEAVINGEPSGWDGYALGYRGFLPATYRVETRSVHTSRPDPNALQFAMNWWNRVERAFGADGDEHEDGAAAESESDTQSESETEPVSVFETVTVKPVAVDGGLSEDGERFRAEIDAQFRIPPNSSAEEIQATVERELETGEIEWDPAIPPVMVSPRTPVARALRVGIREVGGDPRPLRKTGTCDMNVYREAWDRPMAVYGPGDSALDHAPNEHLPLVELDRAVAVLEAAAETLTEIR